jgi:hypothetical protein
LLGVLEFELFIKEATNERLVRVKWLNKKRRIPRKIQTKNYGIKEKL